MGSGDPVWKLSRKTSKPWLTKNSCSWKRDPGHPSLEFKKVRGENWSARVSIHHRAIGHFVKDGFLWEWIGTHGEYDRLA
jgi:hypothetical protein